ncbi:hypothetical protein DPMN_176780 [Dreissena polymorpha]|uniref:Uncharacterized protein n=1 Tax=Dreissena polymorpha TaxID=45954 RepID=A0A9D4E9R6_DREPO|nr:hypothetical protein DPMN_176780 [Dreissena polymorpha]
MQDAIDSDYGCQTVAHIPRIARGSVEYAVPIPSSVYSYPFIYFNRSASGSMSEQTGSSKSKVKLADDEEGI